MRTIVSFNEGWLFTKQGKDEPVTLPHTWNAVDGQDGGDDYYRGTCRYTKQFPKPALNPGEEAWLEFKGAAYTADVSVNGEALCHHEGGFSTFRIKLPELKDENTVEVRVDNSSNDRVYPQKADFTFYGGLYRDVNLIIVPASHFELGYCGTSGIKVTPHCKPGNEIRSPHRGNLAERGRSDRHRGRAEQNRPQRGWLRQGGIHH